MGTVLRIVLLLLPSADSRAVAGTGASRPRWPFKFRSMYMNPCHIAPVTDDAVVVRSSPVDEWRNLPTIFGPAATSWAHEPPQCFVQQLHAASARGLGTMLVLQTSGPFVAYEPAAFDNGTANPHAHYHTTVADDCNWPPSARPWASHNASTAPARGVCGLAWLGQTLDFVRPWVRNGTLQVRRHLCIHHLESRPGHVGWCARLPKLDTA
jgi:hypothetical protein